jgi:muramoyltetrapeptide carboxypeptidase
MSPEASTSQPARKPKALRPGDTVGIVAPASPISKDLLDAGCATLARMGYKPFYLPSILDSEMYFAGAVTRRARELEEMFVRDEVRAIICARGGYGSNTLLAELDWAKIAQHPKIFVGYSDITTLLTYLHDSTTLVTFHGPMITKDLAVAGHWDKASWESATTGSSGWRIAGAGALGLVKGQAEGKLYGGCLSMLVASLGTPFEIRTKGTILFIEDVAVKPFQIDRMLMQMRLAGKFEGVQGIIFGEMLDCAQPKDQNYNVQDVVKRVVGELGVPVAFGLRSGHVTGQNVTLPIGVRASLKVGETVELAILEAASRGEKRAVAARDKA